MPPIRQKARTCFKAFSVLELLAAIAIIAVIAILAFPSVQAVYEKSLSTRCVSNLRQIGTALHLYMADNQGEYPPNRANKAYQISQGLNGAPFPQDILKSKGYTSFDKNPKQYSDAGIWYCPADKKRPLKFSIHSYGQNQYLGSDARGSSPDAVWVAWMSKAAASQWSGRLIYLVDHDYDVSPKSTAGLLSHQSWPLPKGSTPTPPSGKTMIDFRHHGVANALMVDGGVRHFQYDDLAKTAEYYIWGGTIP